MYSPTTQAYRKVVQSNGVLMGPSKVVSQSEHSAASSFYCFRLRI